MTVAALLGLISFYGGQSTLGQQQSSLSFKPNPVNWTYGPADADLGDYAQITVPEGYRFAGANDARAILKLMNNPAPEALVGIMSPVAGKWMVVFEFTDVGYVKDAGTRQLNSEAILNKLRKKLADQNKQASKDGTVPVVSVDWEMEPDYNAAQHTLEWALRAEGQAGHTINHVVRLLGRRGFLDGIAVLPETIDFESVPLKELMSNVAFRDGYTYADYRKGDRLSKYDIGDLITAENTADTAGHSMKLVAAWGGGAVALLGICIWAVRRKSPVQANRMATQGSDAAHLNGSRKTLAGTVVRPYHSNGSSNGHVRTRRRKMFDYQKYYADLLLQVSDGTSDMTNREPKVRETPLKAPEPGSQDAHMALIESQMKLIEEQQRLIREQAKLIDEKTRVIQEKTQVLERQVELFGNNIF